jgi:hypothetical protein
LTANYSAEYGFTSGGVINAVTKSGTNQFLGSLYEFLRNAALDSSNYIDGTKKGAFTRNQFGGSGGGPIKKNKVFVFGDYEGLRQRTGIPGVAKVITPNARLGIINDSSGKQITPAQGITNGWLTSSGGCPFANSTNLAPGTASLCVDNTIAAFVNALDPLPNCSFAAPGCLVGPSFNAAHYTFSGAQAVTDNYVTLRGDVKISDKDSLNASWYRDNSSWSKPDSLDTSTRGFLLPNQAISVEETHVFGASMVNSFRLGYGQSIVKNPGLAALLPAVLDTQFGMTSSLSAPGISPQAGGEGLAGITSFGGFNKAGGFSDWVHTYQVFDDATRTFGNHSVKFGFMFLRNHTDLVNGNGNGSASFLDLPSFLQNITATVRMPTSPPFTAGNTKHYNRNSVFGGYIQDNWKMRSNLTVNLGLRYEMSTIPFEISRKFRILPTLWADPGSCVADINGLPIDSTCTALRDSVFASNPTLKNFEPRVGFAWDPFHSGKTSVRGGFGLFDVLPMPFMFGLNALQASPAGAEVDLGPTQLHAGTNQGLFGKNGGFTAIALSTPPSQGGRFQYEDPNPRRNYVMQWNVNVQRQITASTSVTLAYAGSRGIHNPFQTDTLNTVFPTKTSAGWLFPTTPSNVSDSSGVVPLGTPVACSSPFLAPGACGSDPTARPTPTGITPGLLVNPFIPNLILSTVFMSQSWYNSFQANVAKKMSHGLQMEVSFTWQKSMDTSSGSFAGDNYSSNPTAATPWWDLSIIKGLSDFNVGRNLTVNWLWNIPTPASFSGPAGWIARGWGVGGLVEISDGSPIWPLTGLGSDPLGQINQEPMSIPDLAPGCTPKNVVQPGNLQYLKPKCFILPIAPVGFDPTHTKCDQGLILANPSLDPNTCGNLLGHLPRNSIIGPGLVNADVSFIKDNHIKSLGETFNIQFRAELFNIFNHTNYASPSDNLLVLDPLPVGGFGQIDLPTQVPMREMQFALKIVF